MNNKWQRGDKEQEVGNSRKQMNRRPLTHDATLDSALREILSAKSVEPEETCRRREGSSWRALEGNQKGWKAWWVVCHSSAGVVSGGERCDCRSSRPVWRHRSRGYNRWSDRFFLRGPVGASPGVCCRASASFQFGGLTFGWVLPVLAWAPVILAVGAFGYLTYKLLSRPLIEPPNIAMIQTAIARQVSSKVCGTPILRKS